MSLNRDRDFEVVSQFMKGDKETQSSLFDEMVGLTGSLLSQLKTVLAHGTREEKKAVLAKVKFLHHVMQEHYKNMKAKVNLTDEELNLVVSHFVSSSPVHRDKLQNAKQEFDAHKNDLNNIVSKNKRTRSNSVKTKSKWIRS
jgi:hypothetical protein